MAQPVVFWFRRDLRLKDNHGLTAALQSGTPVIPIFIFDSKILKPLERDDARLGFIVDTVQALHDQLSEKGSGIFTFHGDPVEVFEEVLEKFKPQAVYTNEDYEPYAIQRDERVRKLLKSKGVEFHSFKDQVIFAKDDVLKDDGKPYTVYTPYSRKWLKLLGEIPEYRSEKLLGNLRQGSVRKPHTRGDLDFQKSAIEIPRAVISKPILKEYAKKRNFPSEPTSLLGIHLRFGTLSVRHAMKVAQELSPVWLSELIWREFFMMILFHFPHTVNEPFRPAYKKIQWRNNKAEFQRWCEGRTGYPIVDAGMRELNATGFMHNRVRMVVASFLTKHLLIDWVWGERYFASRLLDFELSSNVGNWQWAAGCGCDAAPYFRVFNPALQQKKFDPKNTYVRKWVPEFESTSYDSPMVEHELARRRVLQAYQLALKGGDE